MIRWLNFLQVLGFFVLALAVPLAVALSLSLLAQDGGRMALGMSTAVALGSGLFLSLALRPERHDFNLRESTLLVVMAWMAAAVFGALPFYFSPYFPSFTDAFFESMSGFTTTGATVLTDIESLPDSLHFWRCLTHWLGGMGIILLGVAILPLIGAGGMELYRAEFSGASSEKLKPRIAETAKALWRIYVAFSLAEYVALRLAGMDRLDAVCHTFSTMGTGGFSTRAASIESFQSPQIEMVITVFMILAGVNFTQHYRLFVERRPRAFLGDLEIRSLPAAHPVGDPGPGHQCLLSSTIAGMDGVASIPVSGSLDSDHDRLHLYQFRSVATLCSAPAAGTDVLRGLHGLHGGRSENGPHRHC